MAIAQFTASDQQETTVQEIVRPPAWVRPAAWCVALSMGGVHALAAALNHSMNPDGLAYLEIGEAYLRGDWGAAVNTYWSPLYSWILGSAMWFVQPSMAGEFPLIHLVNFVIFVGALLCFERFWLELDRERQERFASESVTWPAWLWWALGYSLFVYAALVLVRVWSVTPDMIVAGVVFLAGALIVRIRRAPHVWQNALLLGAVLGVGYLSKTAMLPLASVFLGVTLLSAHRLGDGVRSALIAAFFLMLVAGPYIAVLSASRGAPTFGETGRLMYAWHINAVPHPHWVGEIPGAGTPVHGSQRIFESPAIYEFSRPSHGTYPIAYDPVYWYEGVTPFFEWRGQARVLAASAQYFFELFFRQLGGLIAAVLVLMYLGRRESLRLTRRLVRDYGLAIIALLALAMYAAVHVQGRYVGAFLVLLLAELLARVRLPASAESQRQLSFVGGIALAVILVNVLAFNLERGGRFLSVAPAQASADQGWEGPRWPGEIAQALHRYGVRPGDGVAVIGYGFDSYWARMARVQIIAEMFDEQAGPFWSGSPAFQSAVLRAFAGTGAMAIVAERLPAHVDPAGWHRVGSSSYYIYMLSKHANTP